MDKHGNRKVHMCAHYIDNIWELQAYVLETLPFPERHTGVNIDKLKRLGDSRYSKNGQPRPGIQHEGCSGDFTELAKLALRSSLPLTLYTSRLQNHYH